MDDLPDIASMTLNGTKSAVKKRRSKSRSLPAQPVLYPEDRVPEKNNTQSFSFSDEEKSGAKEPGKSFAFSDEESEHYLKSGGFVFTEEDSEPSTVNSKKRAFSFSDNEDEQRVPLSGNTFKHFSFDDDVPFATGKRKTKPFSFEDERASDDNRVYSKTPRIDGKQFTFDSDSSTDEELEVAKVEPGVFVFPGEENKVEYESKKELETELLKHITFNQFDEETSFTGKFDVFQESEEKSLLDFVPPSCNAPVPLDSPRTHLKNMLRSKLPAVIQTVLKVHPALKRQSSKRPAQYSVKQHSSSFESRLLFSSGKRISKYGIEINSPPCIHGKQCVAYTSAIRGFNDAFPGIVLMSMMSEDNLERHEREGWNPPEQDHTLCLLCARFVVEMSCIANSTGCAIIKTSPETEAYARKSSEELRKKLSFQWFSNFVNCQEGYKHDAVIFPTSSTDLYNGLVEPIVKFEPNKLRARYHEDYACWAIDQSELLFQRAAARN